MKCRNCNQNNIVWFERLYGNSTRITSSDFFTKQQFKDLTGVELKEGETYKFDCVWDDAETNTPETEENFPVIMIWFNETVASPFKGVKRKGQQTITVTIPSVFVKISFVQNTVKNGYIFRNFVRADNYSIDKDSIVPSLMQRLSVLKGELWYQVNYGLPLVESHNSPVVFDMVIYDIISSHPGVSSIRSYQSEKVGHTYTFTCEIVSIYSEELTLTNSYAI